MSLQKSDIAEAISADAAAKNQGLPKGDTKNETSGHSEGTFVVGETICIRTVTIACVGKVVRTSRVGMQDYLHLSNFVWIADFGEFKNALSTGKLQKSEKLPGIIRVPLAPVVDIHPWNHPV